LGEEVNCNIYPEICALYSLIIRAKSTGKSLEKIKKKLASNQIHYFLRWGTFGMNPPHVGGLLDWAAKKLSQTRTGKIGSFVEVW